MIQSRKTPDSFRTAISRAYYAALHAAAILLADMGIAIPRTANVHDKIPDLLQHSEDSEIIIASERLKNLREERNQADYRLEDKNVEEEDNTRLRLNDAGRIIGILNTFRMGKGQPGSRFERAKSPAQMRAQLLFLGAVQQKAT